MESFDPEPLAGTEDGTSPFFSPDGHWIGFFAGGFLKKTALSGGGPINLAPDQDNRGGAWAGDGTIVYSPGGRGGLLRIRSDGGEPDPLTTVDTTHKERTHRWPLVLPDGKTVLFIVGSLESPDYYEDAEIS